MATDKPTIAAIWTREDGARQVSLNTARLCAALTKPGLLPPLQTTPDAAGAEASASAPMQDNFQSLGAFGVANVAGKMLSGFFPPLLPWFKLNPAARILYNPQVKPKQIEQIKQLLFLRELMIQAMLDSAGGRPDFRGRISAFRAAKLRSILQCLVTGDTLEKMDDDYRLRTFRRDTYITKRDTAGDVLYHVTLEELDALTLTDEELARAKLKKADVLKKGPDERMVQLYTYPEYQPRSRTWTIVQEVDGHTIGETEEPVSPFFSTPYELVNGEHYGRGFVESNKGDLRSLDKLTERELDWSGLASKHTPIIDETSNVRARDLDLPSGVPIRARMGTNGKPVDIGWFGVDRPADFKVVEIVISRIEARVSKVFLIGSGSVRQSDRTTAFEVQKTVLAELENATGGLSTQVAEFMQVPTIHRANYQMERGEWDPKVKRWVPVVSALPKNAVDIQILTGVSALVREQLAQKMVEFAQLAVGFGPEGIAKVNIGALLDAYARARNFYEPAVVRSDEEAAAIRKQQAAEQLQLEAGQQAIKSAGAVTEAHLTPRGPQAQPRR